MLCETTEETHNPWQRANIASSGIGHYTHYSRRALFTLLFTIDSESETVQQPC